MYSDRYRWLVVTSAAVLSTLCHAASNEYTDEPDAYLCEKDMFDDANYPIGRGTSFVDLIELGNLFVDKSLLMKEVMNHENKVILLVLPPAWGKTTNHQMMNMFFEIQMDDSGKRQEPRQETRNYVFFQKGLIKSMYGSTIRFKSPPTISKDQDFCDKYQGRYPVLNVNLFRPYPVHAEGAIDRTYKQISKALLDHYYITPILTHISELSRDHTEAQKTQARQDLEKYKRLATFKETNVTEMAESLKFMCRLLYEFHHQRVIVLVDEYNHMLNHLERQWSDEQSFHKRNVGLEEGVLNFYNHLMTTTFEANEYLEKAFITGSLHIAGQRIFSNLTDFAQYDSLNNRFDRFYGFTRAEIDLLFERAKVPVDLVEKAINWYTGFRTNLRTELVLYNPWDMAKFLEHQSILNFWENAVCKDSVRNLFNVAPMHRRFVLMARGDNVTLTFQHVRFEKQDILRIAKFYKLKRNDRMSEEDMDLVMRRLYAAGYLTIAGVVVDPFKGVNRTEIGLANQEMRSEVARIMNLNVV